MTLNVTLTHPCRKTFSTSINHNKAYDVIGAILKQFDPGADTLDARQSSPTKPWRLYSGNIKIGEAIVCP